MRGSPLGLVIFDVDGTLAQTNAIDESCYARAVEEVLGFQGFSTDWGAYEHSTDNGILHELIWTMGRRAPSLREMRAVRARFIELIEEASHAPVDASTHAWSEVDGAREMLDALPAKGWQVAIATGGWGPSARRKLQRVGITLDDHPFACADHAFSRLSIIQRAMHEVCGRNIAPEFPVIYVGDGPWDIDAAHAGGYGFVGIGQGERALRLTSAGAVTVLRDYRDLSAFEAALMGARTNHQGQDPQRSH